MTASVTSPSGLTELCDIVSLDDNHYSIKFVPKEMGVHTVCVKHKDMHIPGKVKVISKNMLTTCIDFLVEADIRKQKKSDFIPLLRRNV